MQITRETVAQTGIATTLARDRTATRAVTCRVISEDAEDRREVTFGSRPIVVGASPECDLVLTDEKVSRRHVELQLLPEGVRVRDLDSTNGTYVDAARISEAIVPAGGTLRCGKTTLQLLRAPIPLVPPSERTRFGGLVADSPLMRELFAVLELAAPTDATVLLEGESGTGQELAARAIHDHSPRASGPFVVVDCSAANEALIESQLFGHKVGAFTGAVSDRKGAFVEADGGTIFLDELGELPLASQARLLRVLESRTVQPLGSDRTTSFDVRVVAATHRDLLAMVNAKKFRFDLFHRIVVVHVFVPPLRDRPEDLPALIRYFYEGRGVDPGPVDGVNLDQLQQHPWPGNVRELRNALERAWVLSGAGAAFRALNLWLGPSSAEPVQIVDTSMPFKEAKERWVAEFERRYLMAVYERNGCNITHAASEAQVSRRHFRELLEHHGLKKP